MALSPGVGSPYPWLRELKPEDRGLYLIHLLFTCSDHVSNGNIENANMFLEQISHLCTPNGDTMQRIAAYFSEALAHRLLKRWSGLYKALNATNISPFSEQTLVQRLFFHLLPFLKISYLITNQAIIEAIEGEKMVHIIDLHSFEPAQWISLLRALSAQPEGPPHLRITGIHEQKEVLDEMACQLNKEAEIFDIPFQFNPVVSRLEDLDVDNLRVKTGEALVISSILRLHSLLAFDNGLMCKSASVAYLQKLLQTNTGKLVDFPEKGLIKIINPIVNSTSLGLSYPVSSQSLSKLVIFLKDLCRLSPKLMVVTEQEANHNGASLMERVMESLNFYAALFDCLDSKTLRVSIERQKLEKSLFGEEIKNIIASEGVERKERHEKLEKWVQRLELGGFGKVPLSFHGALLARRFLENNGFDGCNIKEDNGCVFLCRQDRPLYSVSAWRFRMYD